MKVTRWAWPDDPRQLSREAKLREVRAIAGPEPTIEVSLLDGSLRRLTITMTKEEFAEFFRRVASMAIDQGLVWVEGR